jgi:cold shock CspA family protein
VKNRELGTIATYNGTYCFIRRDDGDSKDIFAHESELPKDIHRGDRVSFDVAPDPFKSEKYLHGTFALKTKRRRQPMRETDGALSHHATHLTQSDSTFHFHQRQPSGPCVVKLVFVRFY